jgi:single-stranded DNA-binding protein
MVRGKQIAVSGRLRIDSQRSELPDGGTRYVSYTSVVVQHVQFLDRKAAPAGAGAEEPAAEEEAVPF